MRLLHAFITFLLLFGGQTMAYVDYSPSHRELRSLQEQQGRTLSDLKLLVVVSSEDQLVLEGGKVYKTGHYLGELYEPLFVLMDFGLKEENIVFASIGDLKKPSIDANSTRMRYPFFNRIFPFIGGSFNKIWPKAQDRDRALEMYGNNRPSNISQPIDVAEILATAADDFDVVFFPGGHAPMIDLKNSPRIGKLINNFFTKGKLIAAICHAPVVFQALDKVEHSIPIDNRTITVFSNVGERFAEVNLLKGQLTSPYPQDILTDLGFNIVYNNHINRGLAETVVWDREFVTGQNQFSANKFGRLLVYAILSRSEK